MSVFPDFASKVFCFFGRLNPSIRQCEWEYPPGNTAKSTNRGWFFNTMALGLVDFPKVQKTSSNTASESKKCFTPNTS